MDNMEGKDSYCQDSVIIDIPLDLGKEQWSKCWIHRVPRKLRKVNESAYTPQLVSIGPFHHQKQELQAMEIVKGKYHQAFCDRVKTKNGDDPCKKFVKYIKEHHGEIRSMYAGSTIADKEDESFDNIILKDACFIIELFLRNINEEERPKDYILSTPLLKKTIELDLILLENQLPFNILAQLYGFFLESENTPNPISYCDNPTKSHDKTFCSLLKLTYPFFKDHALSEPELHNSKFKDLTEIKHFTDLLREFWHNSVNFEEENDSKKNVKFSEHKYLYCATKLDRAGVVFSPAPKETSLTAIELKKTPFLGVFPGMTLKLPVLKIESDTECLLRNVMALEQCLYPGEDYICSYVALMDQLINTSEDVDFLVEKKIITNLLGCNKEAATLFNGLCCQIPRDSCCYASDFEELNTFYENRWNVYKAMLKKVYFKDLWTSSSTVVGIFVLLFTISATTRNVLR